jgi:hypothetical protein
VTFYDDDERGPVPDQQADPGEPVTSFTGDDFALEASTPAANPIRLTPASQAVPVYERAAETHSTRCLSINSTSMLLGRRVGRKYVVLSCPTTYNGSANANGFQVSDTRSYVDVNAGYQVNPGDSIEIDSEAPVWVGVLNGNTTGVVQWSEVFNPAGGHSDP